MRPPRIAGRAWRAVATAIAIQPPLWFIWMLFPRSDGAYGAPFAYGWTGGCWACMLGNRFEGPPRLDWPVFAVDLVVTAGLFIAISLLTRTHASWLPPSATVLSIPIGVVLIATAMGDTVDVSWALWMIVVAGYSLGALISLALARRRGRP